MEADGSVIAVDIGNSRIACGHFQGSNLKKTWYCDKVEVRTSAESIAGCLETMTKPARVVVSSVVPDISNDLIGLLKKTGIDVERMSLEKQSIIAGTYPTLGLDRLANAIAAYRLHSKNGRYAMLAIDFGSATTLTTVDRDGRLLGGLIALGLGRSLASVKRATAQLPEIPPDRLLASGNLEELLTPLATSTEAAIVNGVVYGQIGMVDRWIEEARDRLKPPVGVVATGGLAAIISNSLRADVIVDVDLTLKGINLFAQEAAVQEDRA